MATAAAQLIQADPTGSQAVRGVQVATIVEEDACQAASDAAPGLLRADKYPQPGGAGRGRPRLAGRAA